MWICIELLILSYIAIYVIVGLLLISFVVLTMFCYARVLFVLLLRCYVLHCVVSLLFVVGVI